MTLSQLLIDPPVLTEPSVEAWHARWLEARANQSLFDSVVECGLSADRLAGAFVAGYQAAVRVLVPELEQEAAFITLSVTEEEGNRPRHIKSQLLEDGGLKLSGKKRWASLSNVASLLLVAARKNERDAEKPELVLIKVRTDQAGVSAELMPPTKFVPEIGHGAISLNNVAIEPSQLLEGDGYSDYIKPFRMIEDCHVSAACAACLLRVAKDCGWPAELCSKLVTLIALLRQAAVLPVDDAVAHLIFDEARHRLSDIVDMERDHWQSVDAERRARWQRDLPLLGVAQAASSIRVERAQQILFG